jgi:hypothetical protein
MLNEHVCVLTAEPAVVVAIPNATDREIRGQHTRHVMHKWTPSHSYYFRQPASHQKTRSQANLLMRSSLIAHDTTRCLWRA